MIEMTIFSRFLSISSLGIVVLFSRSDDTITKGNVVLIVVMMNEKDKSTKIYQTPAETSKMVI
jgi:hypothetical protein